MTKSCKRILLVVLCAMLAVCMGIFAACNGGGSGVTHTVSFDSNGGSTVADMEVKDGDALNLPTPTRNDYAFDGWYTDDECTLKYAGGPVKSDFTLYAKWTATAYTLTLVLPEDATVTKSVKAGEKFDLGSVVEYNHYKYLCKSWSDGTNTYAADEEIEVTKNLTLTGEFEFLPFIYELALDGQSYSIDGNNGLESEAVVPAVWNGLPVKTITSMGDSDTLKKLTVPATVETISEGAFGGLSALEELDVAYLGGSYADYDDVGENHSLGYWFYDATGYLTGLGDKYYGPLRNYYMPNGHYSPDATSNEANFRDVYVPRSLKRVTVRGGAILDYAFSNMAMLTEVAVGDEVTHIAANAFRCDLNAHAVTEQPDFEPALEVTFGAGSKLSYLGYGAFDGNVSLVSIEIPKGVEELHGRTFAGCSNLTEVTFAQGTQLHTIGDREFYIDQNNDAAPHLTHIDLPETLGSIGTFAFENLTSLEEIVIPAGVTTLGAAMFRGCEGLLSASFASGSTISEIPGSFFDRCLHLAEVTIPETVVTVGEHAFSNCQALGDFDFSHIVSIGMGAFNACAFTAVTVPANVTSLGDSAFANNDLLQSIVFENTLETLTATLDDCDVLTAVTFPQGLKTIGEATFRNCESLTSVVIPATVETIGQNAFSGIATGLKSVTFAKNSQLKTIGESAFSRQDGLTSISLPASLVTIAKDAFSFCDGIISVTFEGTNLQDIGEGAFRRMSALEEFTLPEGVKNIGASAFEDDVLLTELTIPTSVETIGSNAFKGCTNLIILLSYDAASYGEASAKWANDWHGDTPYSFAGGDSEVQIDENFKGIYFEEYGVVYIMEYVGTGDTLVLQDKMDYNGGTDLEVRYHRGLFKGKTNLVTVTLPETMTEVPDEFFSGCTKLQTVNAAKLTDIGKDAFRGCSSLATLSADLSKLKSVEAYAFYNCDKWTATITLTASLTELGDDAFYNCLKLTVEVGEHGFDSLAEIGAYAFYYVVVKGVESGGNKVLTIPGNVKKIGDKAFYMSRGGFDVVIFEDGVDSVGAGAFEACSKSSQPNRNYVNYFLFKGTPSFIGNGFAANNFSDDKHSFKSRIYFETLTFEQGLLLNGYVGDWKIVLPWGKVTSEESAVKGWGSMWYYYDTNEDASDADIYMPVFGKGQWTYGDDGVPLHHTKEEHFGTYSGEDSLWNWGSFVFTVSESGISISYDEDGSGESVELEVTIRFAFHDGYILEVNEETLYVYFQFGDDGAVTAGIFVSHFYFTDPWYEEDVMPDGVHVEFHPVKEEETA